jgi:membrane protease YdiL (CAAX protease family)
MTEVEKAGGIVPFLVKTFRKAVHDFGRQAAYRWNVKYFVFYAAANFLIIILFMFYQSFQPVNLNLQPVTSPQAEGSFLLFIVMVILMPLSLLFEEFLFRLLPMFFVRDLFHLNELSVVEGERPFINHGIIRLWLFRNWLSIFIVVSAVWAALWHLTNIVNSDLLGILFYFGVQFFSGAAFAWIYSRHGLGASWAVHTAWDLFLIALNLIIVMI